MHQRVHRLLNAAFGLGDVLALDALGIQLSVGLQQLQRGGQVVVHELAHAGQLVGVGLGLLKNFGRDSLQTADLVAHLLVGDGIVDAAQFVQDLLVPVLGLRGLLGRLGLGLLRFGGGLGSSRFGGFALDH